MAVVESIRERPGYENVPLRLKWPNDIYTETKNDGLKKVGGLLINSTFVDDEFVLVIGKYKITTLIISNILMNK